MFYTSLHALGLLEGKCLTEFWLWLLIPVCLVKT